MLFLVLSSGPNCAVLMLSGGLSCLHREQANI